MTNQDRFDGVLVTGGDGFVGRAIVSKILETHPKSQIFVLDLPTSRSRFPSVKYYDVDISDEALVLEVVKQTQPRIIFHAACTYSLLLPAETHSRINTQGTFNILKAAQSVGTVKAFIYHSSSSVIEDGWSSIINATEESPVLFSPQQRFPYPLSKALAEKSVLSANRRGGMLTVSLRPSGTFGEGDFETMEKLFANAESGKSNIQMGDGTNVYDFTYIENLVHAHLLAANALLRTSSEPEQDTEERVDGEAFHITNDEPWLFWDFIREIAKQAGHEVKKEDIKIIPRWAGMLMAFFAEWVVWIFSGGRKDPPLTRFGVRYSCITRTLNIKKAERRLGYFPIIGMREGIERSVRWFQENNKKAT